MGGHGVPPLQLLFTALNIIIRPRFRNSNDRGKPHVPLFEHFPYPRRYNTLRLLGNQYNSVTQLCAITLVVDSRRPVFAAVVLAKTVLAALLSGKRHMRLCAFSVVPDHLHCVSGIKEPERTLCELIGNFKSYTAHLY